MAEIIERSISTPTLQSPTPWMWISSPFLAFRLRTLRGILENEQFLEAHDPQFRDLSSSDKRSEAYRFMNLQRNILWIVRFFALAAAGVLYYFLFLLRK